MAIAYSAGGAGSVTSAATSVATAAFAATAAHDLIVAVALSDTTKSVSSISDTAGNTFTLQASVNGTGVRTEIWKAHGITGNASNVVTANLSGSCLAAIAATDDSGVTATAGNTSTATGSDAHPRAVITTQRMETGPRPQSALCVLRAIPQLLCWAICDKTASRLLRPLAWG